MHTNTNDDDCDTAGYHHLGPCSYCGRIVINDGELYPRGPTVVLCPEHRAITISERTRRLVYCLACRRITFVLDFKVNTPPSDPVLFNEDCPVCKKEFESFHLMHWDELPDFDSPQHKGATT